jgi:hypothetical protein
MGELRCYPGEDGLACIAPEDISITYKEEGEACMTEDGRVLPCVGGLYCDTAQTQTCQPRVGLGELCSNPAACEPETWCDNITDPSAPVCAAKREPGAQCPTTASCAPGDCIEGVCAQALCHQERCDTEIAQVCLLHDL